METTTSPRRARMVAPIHVTASPPSHLCQASGKPATAAQRSASAASRAAARRVPRRAKMGSST
eukprot:11186733-Lingulodinium_polyedra.AAC.1